MSNWPEDTVVWVRVKNSKLFWVGRVTSSYPADLLGRTKIPPIAIVKYFPPPPKDPEEDNDEEEEEEETDEYEVVRKENEILTYQCDKREEFIRKGKLSLAKNSDQLARFIRDCQQAETLTGGDPATVTAIPTQIQTQPKKNIWAEICQSSAPPKVQTPTPTTPATTTNKKRGAGSTGSPAKKARQNISDKKYPCPHCNFGTDRVNLLQTHVKVSHPNPKESTTTEEPEKEPEVTGATSTPETPKKKPEATPKTRGRKRKPPKEQAKQDILADWQEQEEEDSDSEPRAPKNTKKAPAVSAVDLFDTLFKNNPAPEGEEQEPQEPTKQRRKDSLESDDVDSSEEAENILKAVGPERKDSFNEESTPEIKPTEVVGSKTPPPKEPSPVRGLSPKKEEEKEKAAAAAPKSPKKESIPEPKQPSPPKSPTKMEKQQQQTVVPTPTSPKKTVSKNIVNPPTATKAIPSPSKQAKPTATIKPVASAVEEPPKQVAKAKDEMVAEKVVHLLPVENTDGSVTYMLVALDDHGNVKIESAEAPKLTKEEPHPHIFVDKPVEPKKLLSALTRPPGPTAPAILGGAKKAAVRKSAPLASSAPKILRAPTVAAAASAQFFSQNKANVGVGAGSQPQGTLTQVVQETTAAPVQTTTVVAAAAASEAPVVQEEPQQFYIEEGEGQSMQYIQIQDQGLQLGGEMDLSQLGEEDTIYLLQEDGTLILPSALGLNLNQINLSQQDNNQT